MSRIVTGTIRTPTGQPWPNFDVQFTVKPSTTTLAASYPEETVTVTTGEDGTFAVELETGIPYQVGLGTIFVRRGASTQYPPGSLFQIVVPEGEGPISLEAIRVAGMTPATPSVVDAVTAIISDTVQGAAADAVPALVETELDARLAVIDGGTP